jgi:CheY-like chemotaxis protein
MEETSKLLAAIATLAWPVIVIGVIWVFRPAVGVLIDSAKTREFSIEIGGQKLSMKEANTLQNSLIADLQAQVSEIKQKLENAHLASPNEDLAANGTRSIENTPTLTSVLWVDDNPKNNSYFIEQIEQHNVHVDLALTTEEGLKLLKKRRYSVVLSDMGRFENGTENPTAGVALVKAIRATDSQIPIYIHCSAQAAEKFGSDALTAGANAVSASPTQLYTQLNLQALKIKA